MKKRYIIKVFGRVQGVYFRGSARDMARRLNIKGFAKNKYDGSVLIEAEGNIENLNAFLKWCNQGPDHAMVEEVVWKEESLIGYEHFEIRF